jgi:quercetin dioxygenase-like cupin family protein
MRQSRVTSRLLVPLAALAFACSSSRPESVARVELDLPAQAQNLSGGPVAKGLVHEDADVSINVVRIGEPIALHRHLQSEEVVYLLSGEGTLQLALDTRALRAGDLVVVPRNTPHAFTPTGSGPAVVLQLFTPRFVDGDRVLEAPAK